MQISKIHFQKTIESQPQMVSTTERMEISNAHLMKVLSLKEGKNDKNPLIGTIHHPTEKSGNKKAENQQGSIIYHRSKRTLPKEHQERIHETYKEFKQFTNDLFRFNDQLFEFGKSFDEESSTKSEAKH